VGTSEVGAGGIPGAPATAGGEAILLFAAGFLAPELVVAFGALAAGAFLAVGFGAAFSAVFSSVFFTMSFRRVGPALGGSGSSPIVETFGCVMRPEETRCAGAGRVEATEEGREVVEGRAAAAAEGRVVGALVFLTWTAGAVLPVLTVDPMLIRLMRSRGRVDSSLFALAVISVAAIVRRLSAVLDTERTDRRSSSSESRGCLGFALRSRSCRPAVARLGARGGGASFLTLVPASSATVPIEEIS
jgi:hypothetical protein